MMKNKYVKIILPIFIIFVFSFLLSFYITNREVLHNLSSKERKNEIIDINKISSENLIHENNALVVNNKDAEKIITIPFNDEYVYKFSFDYNTVGDYSWVMEVEGTNFYDQPVIETFKGNASAKIKVFSETIKMHVKSIKITFEGEIENLSNFRSTNSLNNSLHMFALIFLITLTLYILIKYKKYFSNNIEKGFLLIAIVTGMLLIYSVPKMTFISWDDETHFTSAYRLFQYPNVEWTETTNQMRFPWPYHFEEINTNEEYEAVAYYFDAMHSYENPIIEEKSDGFVEYTLYAYLPSAMALSIGRILNLPFSILISMGRVANLLVYGIITYFAIKKIPIYKKLLTFIALLPSTLWLSCQYSCDSLITACIFLSISIIIYELYNRKEKLSLKHALLFIIPLTFACFAKAIYAPLFLLIFFLPKEKFESKNERIIFNVGTIGVMLLLLATFVAPILMTSEVVGDLRGGDTSISRQLILILNNIPGYLRILADNAGKFFTNRLLGISTLSSFSYMGEVSETNIPCILMMGLLFFTYTDTPVKEVITKKQKIAMLLLVLVIIVMIWSSMYLAFTPVGDITINGVQPRYFIPLIFPFLMCINSNKIVNKIDNVRYTQILFITMFIIMILCTYLNVIKLIYN